MRTKGAKDKELRIMPDLESRIMRALFSNSTDQMQNLLPPDDYSYYLRLKFLNNLYLQHFPQLSEKDVRNAYMREYSVSDPTYHRDRNMCFRIFGPQLKPDLEYLKGAELQMAIRDRSLARAAGDYKSVLAFYKYIMDLMGLAKPITNPGDGEVPAQQIIINMQINNSNGTTEERQIDMALLDKLKPAELEAFAEIMDVPAVGLDQMAQMFNELNAHEPDTTED